MKKLVVGGVVAGGLMLGGAALVLGAGLAHADTHGSRGDHNAYAYAAELRADGMSGTADSAENLASQVCLARINGHTEQEAIDYAETMPMPTKTATDVVMGAEWHFCPQYATFSNRLDQILGPGTSTTGPSLSATVAGTDPQGWLGYRAVRCDSTNPAVAVARTTKSVFVVCQSGPGNYYYRGLRLSDGASIELANAVRSSAGWDVTNPTDGTRYEIRPDSLTIAKGQIAEPEPMVQYASSSRRGMAADEVRAPDPQCQARTRCPSIAHGRSAL